MLLVELLCQSIVSQQIVRLQCSRTDALLNLNSYITIMNNDIKNKSELNSKAPNLNDCTIYYNTIEPRNKDCEWSTNFWDLFCPPTPPPPPPPPHPPGLVSINLLWPPGAQAIFLHSNVQYNYI